MGIPKGKNLERARDLQRQVGQALYGREWVSEPLDPSVPFDRLLERELIRLNGIFSKGNEFAAWQALVDCGEPLGPVPNWVTDYFSELLDRILADNYAAATLLSTPRETAGRHSSPLSVLRDAEAAAWSICAYETARADGYGKLKSYEAATTLLDHIKRDREHSEHTVRRHEKNRRDQIVLIRELELRRIIVECVFSYVQLPQSSLPQKHVRTRRRSGKK